MVKDEIVPFQAHEFASTLWSTVCHLHFVIACFKEGILKHFFFFV